MLIKVNGPRYQRGANIVDPLEQYSDDIDRQQEIDKLDRTRLSPRELRVVAESFALAGMDVDVKITDEEVVVIFSRWKTGATRKTTFSAARLPWESQARAMLRCAADAVKC